MLPGRTFEPADLLTIVRRRLWVALVPFALIAGATALAVRTLPAQYRSESLILVVPQRVPESYVRSTITTRIEDRLQAIKEQILSRTRLERIIEEFDVYAELRRSATMEEVVARMAGDVQIEVVRGDTVRVSYIGSDPHTVMKVTERLATSVVEESLRAREVLADGTNQFLEAQLDDARHRLIEHEKKLEQYKRRHAGELPSQLTANLQAIQNAQVQIQSLVESINRDRDRRLIVERQLMDAEQEPLPAVATVQDATGGGALTDGTAAQQLAAARLTLRSLELRLKPSHPDVVAQRRRIRDLEAEAAAEAQTAPTTRATPAAAVSPALALRLKRANDLRLELEQFDQQIAAKQSEEKRLRASVASYQQRAEMAPTREVEMVELTRDYATLQQMYTNLLAKREDAKLSANLERRQVGEQFKLVDAARLPERPYSPNRQRLILLGLVAGLVFGIGLAGLLEYRDSSFRSDVEIERVIGLPVLAVVPSMRTAKESRRRRRARVVLNCGFGMTVLGSLAVVAYTFVR